MSCLIAIFSGPLRPAEYYAIRRNYPGLVNDMPANQVVDFMFAGGIVNSEQMNKMSPMSAEEKARMILDSVLRHPKGYDTLIGALESEQCSSDWLAEQLRNDVKEFEKKAADEGT